MRRKKVGIINSGGDCPGLNTVIDTIVTALENDYKVLGFYKGFEGLLAKEFIELNSDFTNFFRFQGGTFLKTVNKGNFSSKVGTGQIRQIPEEILLKTAQNYHDLGLEGLIVLGGDGTMEIVYQLQKYNLNIIGVPKSMDNDLPGTDFTFGFHTAVEIATEALDRLETVGQSHDRIMILEVMGRWAGWVSLFSGLAGGANIILIPEIDFRWDSITNFLDKRTALGKKNTLVIVAEGSKLAGGETSTKSLGSKASEFSLGGIGDQISHFLNEKTRMEARSTNLGHIIRGGSPGSFDRLLSMPLGVHATKLLRARKYGNMVTYEQGKFSQLPIEDCVGKLKLVEANNFHVETGRELGVCFGD